MISGTRSRLPVRGWHTVTELASSLAILLGAFELAFGDPPEAPERPWSGTRAEDVVRHYSLPASYGPTWRNRVQLRFGVQRTHYDKAVRSTSGATSGRISNGTDYDVSAMVNLTGRLALFGSILGGCCLCAAAFCAMAARNGAEHRRGQRQRWTRAGVSKACMQASEQGRRDAETALEGLAEA